MSDTILALAVLKANWEAKHAGYIDNFNVLIAECLRRSPHDVVSGPAVRDSLEENFGLRLPLKTVNLVLRRAAKTGLVYRAEGVYRINRVEVEKLRFEKYRNKFISSYDRLIEDLRMYAEEKYSKQKNWVKWSIEDAERTLHDYLSSNSITLLRAITKKMYIPLPRVATPNQRYIFASYVNSLFERQSEHLNSLQIVLEGHMLATAIFLPDPSSTGAKFQNTSLFFDTRFLMYALGYGGESLEAPHKELLEMVYELGADLCCFQHTADEMISILNGCAKNLSTASGVLGYGPSFDYFLSRGFNESDVLFLAGRLEKELERIRIEIKPKPAYAKEHMIDEKKLEACISSKITYLNPYALQRDIDSISAIPRIRAGHQARLIERCRAIFVTSNMPLVEAANEFVGMEEDSPLVPLGISDWDLTNLTWLKKPLKAPDLPRKRLLADCYAAVQPSDKFRSALNREVETYAAKDVCTPDDVYVLRRSLEVRRLALDLTAGDENAFTEGTVQEVLELYRQRILEKEKATREAAERHAQQLEEEIRERTAKEIAKNAEIEKRAVFVARKLSGIVMVFLVVLAATILYFNIPSSPEWKLFKIPIKYLASGAIFVWSVLNWGWGFTLLRVRRHIEIKMTSKLVMLFKWIGGM
jgi:hypothetical protein